MNSRKTVFLTGATGNMGREAVRRIAARSDLRLRVLVRTQERNHPVVRDIMKRNSAEIVWGDLTNAATVQAGVKGADIVLHVGGLVSPLADNLPPEIVTAVNVGGAWNIVQAIVAGGDADRIRLVYIGTVAQTGSRNPPIHWGRTGDPIRISAYDHYAVTKTQAEAIVAESGIRHWVSLRQSGMAHYDMWRTFDPIMFHNPINGVFEWSTANDSGRLMAAVCDDAVPDEFWRNFYNIGGGASSRLVNHEFTVRSMVATGARDHGRIFRPHWFATRNFHGQWYSDSDRLEELVPFREQSIGDYLKELPRHIPLAIRLAAKIMPDVISKRIEKLARSPGGSLYWFEDNDRAKIDAYFGSRAEWDAIPRDWDKFEYANPSREPTSLNHGYDEAKSPDHWTATDFDLAAEFRGGRCNSVESYGRDGPASWTCGKGHCFDMSPNLVLKGGHWCPKCMEDNASGGIADQNNAFLTQVTADRRSAL